MDEAVFIDRGSGRFVASELARGPWDPGAQHGGASAALLMREFERLPGEPGLEIARGTYELLRPVPLGERAVRAQIVRPGRRVQLLEATVETPDGVDLVRARALRVRALDASLPGTDSEPRPPGPEETGDQPPPFVPRHRPIF